LTLLCVYPSAGGATPDRSPFDETTDPGHGPRSTYVGPADVREVAPSHAGEGVVAGRIIDEQVGGAELFAELLAVPAASGPYRHPAHELLYVVNGTGVAIARDGRERRLEPGGVLSCPAGSAGAHAIRNTGSMPLQLLSILPSADGSFPG
jgi:quercetin dioxygenase-like cupin family protein